MKILLVILITTLGTIYHLYPKTDIEKQFLYLELGTHDKHYMALIDMNTEIKIEEKNDKYIINLKGALPKKFVSQKELFSRGTFEKDLNNKQLYYVEQELELKKEDKANWPSAPDLVYSRILSFNSGQEKSGVKTIKEISLFEKNKNNIYKNKVYKITAYMLSTGVLFLILVLTLVTFVLKLIALIKPSKPKSANDETF